MAEVLSNQSAGVALAAAITASSTAVTRATATNGWPGDSNGPPSGNFRIVVTDGTNYEIMLVTGGQGTTSLPVTRAVELISGVKTAFAFGTNATMTPVPTSAGIPAAIAASLGGPGTATLGGEIASLDASGNVRNVLDDGAGNASSSGNLACVHIFHTYSTNTPGVHSSVTLVSGAAYQAGPWDVILRVPVTYTALAAAAATLAVGIGSTATPTQIVEDSEPAASLAGVVRTKLVYLPANWYVLLTATNAVIGTGTQTGT